MAIDTTLVRGAYQANKPQGVIGVKEITDIGDSIAGGINNYMASVKAKHTVRNAEYDAFAESVLDNSDLTGEQYEALYDQLALGKEDFANSDKKTRSLRLRELQAMAGDYADYKALREDIAINKNDLSPAFTNSPEGKMYLDILKGDGKNLMKKDGRIGIEVNGEWKSISSIKQSLDNNKIDKTSSEMLEAFRINAQTSEDEFNYDETKRNIMNSMVSKGKYKSLINDEIIPGRVFRTDLAESLMNKKYSDLGVTDEDFEGIEGVNSDGIIDAVEAENIIRHLEADKNEMNEVLTNYYTSYIQNNGKSKEQAASTTSGGVDKTAINARYNYTNEQALSNQRILKDEGFDIVVDGIWGPKSQEAWDKHTKSPRENLDFNEEGEFVPGNNAKTNTEKPESKSIISETMPFKSNLSNAGFKIDRDGLDDDILAYFKDMEGRLVSEIYSPANFLQWLKNNNKEQLETNY